MGRSPLHATALALIVALVAACGEDVLRPDASEPESVAPVDSAGMFADAGSGLVGLMLAPVAADSMVLMLPVDSFTIELTHRDCAAPNNWVVLTSPVLDTLSSAMCQESVNQLWSYTQGSYAAGTPVILEFESGFGGGGIYDGKIQLSDTLPASFPEWNLEFEDASDDDFNDFLLRVVAHLPDTVNAVGMVVDDSDLHPAIRAVCPVNSRGGACSNPLTDAQPLRNGDVAKLSAVIIENGVLAAGKVVTLRAEVVEQSGGHTHYAQRHSLTEFPELPNNERLGGLAVQGTAAAGHFRIASVRADSFDVVADSLGRVEVEFVAGFIGGAIEVIAIATLDTLTVADTVAIDVRVPGLVPLEAAGSIASVAYFVGGTTSVHPQGTNWYVRPELVTRLAAIATGLANLISEAGAFYPQFNDASLSRGGSFNGAPGSLLAVSGSAATVDNPLASHATHALGVDLDVAFCYSESSGAGDQSARVSWDSEEGCRHWLTEAPLPNLEMHRGDGLRIMRQYGDAAVHDGNHFHIRFWEGS